MRIPKLVFLTLTAVSLCSFVIAQTQPSDSEADSAKKKKEMDERIMQLLGQAIAGGDSLRLPQNRAIVYAISGDLYWKFDGKRSRELFRNAAAEIITFNQENEKEKRENTDVFAGVFDFSTDARNEILPLVGKHDAELALELLLQTRPAKLSEAILRTSAPNAKPSDGMFGFDPDKQRVSQELALEQQFALLVADENPEKAIKLIKDSLAKGVSFNVMPLLQKLNKKDEKKAAELAGDVIKKLVDSELTKNDEDMRAAISFLQFAFKPHPTTAKEKQFAFSEAQIKDLANKIASTFLQPSKTMMMTMALNQAMPLLEKFAPDKVALLKQRQSENDASLPQEFKRMQEQMKLWDQNSTPEDILAQLPKLQNEFEKMSANQSLISKISQIEDETRAKKLIDQIPDEKTRTSAQEQFEAARIGRSASAGKLDEAKRLIGNLTKKKTQIQRLVALATDFHKKGGEKEIANAKGLMKDAKALINEYAESDEDLGDLMEVVKGYAVVDPDIAFRMFEPVIDQINDYVQASAVISKYNLRTTSFKKGELSLKVNGGGGDMPLFRYIPQMQLLGKADLERMNTLADRFARGDSRTIVKLYLLQGYLKDDKNPDTPAMSGGMTVIFND